MNYAEREATRSDAGRDPSAWMPRPRPDATVHKGRYVRLEPINLMDHVEDLGAVLSGPGTEPLYTYLFDPPPTGAADVAAWVAKAEKSADPFFYAAVDVATGRASGRLSLMRIDPAHGVIEVGGILYSPNLQRTPAATEAVYLLAKYVFETLGYRRFEWKCDDRNGPSRRAAQRFGFIYEGLFRQHMVVKGQNRDTAWFAMLDGEWPARKAAFERWLAPDNFDAEGRQKTSLAALTRTGT